MPFRDESFDAVMCCYLLELLSSDDIVVALQEIHRVLRRRGTFTLVLIGQKRSSSTRRTAFAGAWRRRSGDARWRPAHPGTDRVAGLQDHWGQSGAAGLLSIARPDGSA